MYNIMYVCKLFKIKEHIILWMAYLVSMQVALCEHCD